jgi:hypothetical protein
MKGAASHGSAGVARCLTGSKSRFTQVLREPSAPSVAAAPGTPSMTMHSQLVDEGRAEVNLSPLDFIENTA